ncbi:chorion peroxidase-like [Ornithodoros turicata]|uniref:chorion peroxidase-like n=1 Tax=Ornithodoros turicata TaxID=34597 RepID=UPI003139B440
MRRLLEPAYADGVSSPRASVDGDELPNARYVSFAMHPDVKRPAHHITHMVMQFGQFMDHDIALAPLESDPGHVNLGNPNNPVDCCSPERRTAPECFSIGVPEGDPFYGQHRETCLNMARSAPCSCQLGYREQRDMLTSFLDCSQVYGNSDDDTRKLRLGQGGQLRYQVIHGEELLPRSFHPDRDRCSRLDQGDFCFNAGDDRVNEHPGLTAMHTLWLRQHNRIARALQYYHGEWDDETLFQQARRIVGAQYQHIVYTEWIPLVLGKGTLENFDLQQKGGFSFYDPAVNPTMLNEFAAAAFRMGHTLIDGRFTTVDAQGQETSFLLEDFYFFPFYLYRGQTDDILRGLAKQTSQHFDRFVTNGVTENLYRLQNETFGLDLIALNIQRGRDHGLQPYVYYYHLCTGRSIETFADLHNADVMAPENVQYLAAVYKNVKDVDLFTAGTAERSVAGGVVGPTFACILAHQFKKLKFGDRFYYQHASQAGSFTKDQLREIQKTTLAGIICDNTYTVTSIQKNVFVPEDAIRNPEIPCHNLQVPDLTYW